MVETVSPRRAPRPLKVAGQLARRLLQGRSVVEAFEVYLQAEHDAGVLDPERDAVAASLEELRSHYQTSRPEPYFFELLQAESNRSERQRRGVYFTPGPIVDYIVRRVEQLVPAGPLTLVDPACGAGVFLVAAGEFARRRPGSRLVGFDLSSAAIEATRQVLGDVGVPLHLECVNPLLAGGELASRFLGGEGTLVILGNPPYANYGRLNRGAWIDGLLADYRRDVAEQKLNLTDDFIKFLRWGQHWIDAAGQGVLAMITSRTYLSGITHRGMRRSLAESFSQIEILDLHGDEVSGDENVFPIRRGVAIGIFSKTAMRGHTYQSLSGSRESKLKQLAAVQVCSSKHLAPPIAPDWPFTPPLQEHSPHSRYRSWPRLDGIFSEFISGVQTKNDALFVNFDRETLAERMQRHLGKRATFDDSKIQPYTVGPFDRRWIYYDRELLGRSRWPVMRHMLPDETGARNVGLVFMRQSTGETYDHTLVVDGLASDRVFYSRRGAPFLAPLWIGDSVANFRPQWVDCCATQLGFRPAAESLFAYIYAVLHAPAYRSRFLPELQRDFPRLPWPQSGDSFAQLVRLGQALIQCHLHSFRAPSSGLESLTGDYFVRRGWPKIVEGVVYVNPRQALPGIDAEAWSFELGGYRVMERWLKVRHGRTLAREDLGYLQAIVEAASRTRQLMAEIDEMIVPAL